MLVAQNTGRFGHKELTGRPAGLAGLLVGWQAGYLAHWLSGKQAGSLAVCVIGWLTGSFDARGFKIIDLGTAQAIENVKILKN